MAVTPLSLHKRSEYMKSELITRIQLKNDTEANWLTVADSFVPLVGEA